MKLMMVILVALGMLCQSSPVLSVEADAGEIASSILELLTPLLGDVELALQGFIDIGKIGMGVAKFINIISDQVFNVSLEDMNFGSYIPMADRKILAMFELLSNRLEQMESGVHGIASSLRELADGMQDMVRWEIALDTMEEYMRPIHTLYKRFLLYQELKDKIEDHTLMDFANQVVSHDTHSVMSLMAHLHSMAAPEASLRSGSQLRNPVDPALKLNNPKDVYMVPEKVTRKLEIQEKRMMPLGDDEKLGQFIFRPSLFQMLHQTLQTSDHCSFNQSPQQLVNGLHVLLALTEARGYAMLEFAWMILRVYNEGNFTVEREVAQRLFMQYSEDMLHEAYKVLADESLEYYRCDPKKYVDGDTHVQFTELLQGYIENEVDMNSGGSCTQTCGYYKHTKSEGCYLPNGQVCGKQRRCGGTIHECKFYDADAWVCLSRNPYRRYDYVKYESGLQLGHKNDCEGTTMKVDSWWRWFVHCSYCLCLCDDDESPTTDRFISLMPAFSDTRNNMVVTGIKFTKQRRVIHLKIQQGQALPQGQVNTSTIQWVDVEPINIISTAYQEGTHFKKLSYEDRNIDLDRLSAPAVHVVTGVKFRMLGSHINLEMQVTPVNYTTGELQPFKSYWMSNDNTPAMAKNPRKENKVEDKDDPTIFPLLNREDSVPDSYLKFGPTSRGADVSQLTIPFFDAQAVSPSPSSWFAGIELFHKGQPGSGGFLSLKVLTYDVTQHIELNREGKKMKYISTPVLQNFDMTMEDIVHEHKKGLGVLDALKYISDRLVYFALNHLHMKARAFFLEYEITAAFHQLAGRLSQLEHKAGTVKSSLKRLAEESQGVLRWEIALNTMEEYTRAINTQYDRFLLYQDQHNKVENQTLLEFVRQVVSHDTFSVTTIMGNLKDLAAPEGSRLSQAKGDKTTLRTFSPGINIVKSSTNDKYPTPIKKRDVTQERTSYRSSLFHMLHEAIQMTDTCKLEHSPQQVMKGLYLLLAITEAKAFIMMEFAWMALRSHTGGNYTTEQEMSEHLYMEYSEDILNQAQEVMAKESRDYFTCDPPQHVEGKTFVQMTELLQGFVANEVDLNNFGTCKKNCAYYQETTQKNCFHPEQLLCGYQRGCPGTIRDCKFYDADAWMCLSEDPHRRYDYIRYENGLELGLDGKCNGTGVKVDSWYRWMVYHCSYCLCLCDAVDSSLSDRYISLLPVLSNISNNMVVTGVKFTKVNQVIHIMIQQGEALPQGHINASSIHWVDVTPINRWSIQGHKEGFHYKKLSYEDRSIDLDRLESPRDHVLTGIRLRLLGSHINLEVRVTPVNYVTGELYHRRSYWISNDKTPAMAENPRAEMKFYEPENPIKMSNPNREDSKSNTYLRFGPTSKRSDVAQLTVPFFDAQEVSPAAVSWLSGIDLFHRGQPGSGGFLSLKVITFDASHHMATP